MNNSQNFSKPADFKPNGDFGDGITTAEAELPPRELVAWLVQVSQRIVQAQAAVEEMPCKHDSPSDPSLLANRAP